MVRFVAGDPSNKRLPPPHVHGHLPRRHRHPGSQEISCARVQRNVRALDRQSSHMPDVAGHATRQAAADASPVVRTLPSMRVLTHTPRAQMPAAHVEGRCAPEERSFSVRRKPRSGAPLCPTWTRLCSRWPSWVCAYVSGTNLYGVLEGTETNAVLPELSLTTAFPITLLSVSRRGSSQACA